MSLLGGLMEGRVADGGGRSDIRPFAQQELNHVGLSEMTRHMQGRVAALGLSIDVGTVLHQHFRNRHSKAPQQSALAV